MALEIGLLLELLDDVAIGPRVDLPVERRQIVAGQILAVFGELDAEALERAPVQAGEKSLDDGARLQIERPEPRDRGGIEEARARASAMARIAYSPLAGGGTAFEQLRR